MVDLPTWFIEKYSKPDTALEHPTMPEKPRSILMEPADTQQERERLTGSILASTRQKMNPIEINRLANKYQKMETKIYTFPEENSALLTKTPVRKAPIPAQGKQVFTKPEEFERIVAQAPEEAKVISFKKAFKQARNLGLAEFEYKGNQFNTQEKGETDDQWLSVLKQNQFNKNTPEGYPKSITNTSIQDLIRPILLQNPLLKLDNSTENPKSNLQFSDYTEKAGVIVAENKTVDLKAISQKLGPALVQVASIMQEAGIIPEITSGQRGWGTWSLHELGEAVDLRLKNASPEALESLKKSLPGNPTPTDIKGDEGLLWNDGTYEYIIHGSGDNLHLHIGRDTPETKERLIEHMIKLGLQHKIPSKYQPQNKPAAIPKVN